MSAGPALRLEVKQVREPIHQRFCCHCKTPIDAKRLRRGSVYCSYDCYREDKKERRAFMAKSKCRLCGRGMPKTKVKELEAVR